MSTGSKVQIVNTPTPPNKIIEQSPTSVPSEASPTASARIPVKSVNSKNPGAVISPLAQPQVKQPTQPTGTLCNGTYWNKCPAKQNLICPQTGDAYCEIPQKTGYQICDDMNATWDGSSYMSNGAYNCSCKAGYTSSNDQKSCVPIPSGTVIQTSQQSATQDIQTQINTLNQQILDIKNKYYADKQTLGNSFAGAPNPFGSATNQFQNQLSILTNEANAKIEKLNLQIQSLQSQIGIPINTGAIPAPQQYQQTTHCTYAGGNGTGRVDCY